MKPQPTCAVCRVQTIRTCGGCGKAICAEHGRLGVDANGQKQYLCCACDHRRHQGAAVWRVRG